MNFACVYKTGKDYSAQDVIILKAQVERHSDQVNFLCYTDHEQLLEHDWAIPLLQNNPGWWSVPEVFRTEGPAMVVGLDTIILEDLTPFYELAEKCLDNEFYMIRAFKKTEVFASGIMLWNGDKSWIFDEFDYDSHAPRFRWEQRYTKTKLSGRSITIKPVQDEIGGIYSYKWGCRSKLPGNAKVILFHGHPRPSQVRDDWVVQARRLG